jgi:hypothetical protein
LPNIFKIITIILKIIGIHERILATLVNTYKQMISIKGNTDDYRWKCSITTKLTGDNEAQRNCCPSEAPCYKIIFKLLI